MNVAFIPVRGESKSIPSKNIKSICGKPLVYWVIKAAEDCSDIDLIYISTDSELIKSKVESFGFPKVKIIGRSSACSTDTASTELVMIEFAEKYDFDNIILIQATSPLLRSDDIKRGFELFEKPDTDSVISVVRQKRFNWAENEDGFVVPTNYNIFARPRRQDFSGYLVENGAFYITRKTDLLKYRNRISGNVKALEMNADSFFEIDELNDWFMVESIMKKNGMDKIVNNDFLMPEIKIFLTDCDGCLTDSGMYYSNNGDELKKFNTKDGMGFQLLREKGILTGIITSEEISLIQRRAAKLQLDILRTGVKDKVSEIYEICQQYGFDFNNVAYVGDDLNDIEAIKTVGLGCSVKNGIKAVKNAAKYVSSLDGGDGAVREIIDFILGEGKK